MRSAFSLICLFGLVGLTVGGDDAASRASEADGSGQSYSLDFEIVGDYESSFSIVAVSKYELVFEGEREGKDFKISVQGDIRSASSERVAVEFYVDARVVSDIDDSLIQMTAKGASVIELEKAVTLVSRDGTSRKLTVTQQR